SEASLPFATSVEAVALRQRPPNPDDPTSMTGGRKRLTQRFHQWPGLLLTLAAVFWAGNTVAGRLAVDQISPFMLTFLRRVLVLAVLWPIYGRQVREHWPQIRPRLPAVV